MHDAIDVPIDASDIESVVAMLASDDPLLNTLCTLHNAESMRRESYRYAPHDGQVAFHSDEHRIRAMFTGNRFGKSYSAAHEVDYWCTGYSPYRRLPYTPPVRIRCLADGFDNVQKILIPIFRKTIDPRNLRGGTWETGYSAGAHEIYYANGSTIQFMSYSQKDQGRGAQKFEGDALELFWPDEHCPKEIVDSCRSRVGSRPVHEVYTLTPILGKTWEYDDIYMPWERGDEVAQDIMCFLGDGTDNPHVSQEGLQAMYSRISDPKMRDVRQHGAWINVGGAVYGVFNPEVHVIPYDQKIVDRLTKTICIDPHPAKPDAVLWCGIDYDNTRYAYREALLKNTVEQNCNAIRALSTKETVNRFYFDDNWNWKDKETGKSKREMYEEHGLGPFLPGHERVEDRISRLRELLTVPAIGSPGLFIMDSCTELAEQIVRNHFKPQTEAMREADRWVRVEERDDLLDCLEYYVMSDDVYLGPRTVQGKHLAQLSAEKVRQERAERGLL